MSTPYRICVIGVILVTLLCGCRQPNQFVQPPPPTVTVAHPTVKSVADTIEFVGTTQPTKTVDLRARANGYLEKIFFEDGDDVEVGAELFLIEQAPYQSALDAAKAAQQRAVASLGLAQSQYRRMEPLRANGVVTQEELDVQAAQVETSKADVAAAEAAVRKAELDLGYTKITAPIAGRIGRHMVDIGNLIREEQTQLANIQAIDPIYAYFDVSENDLLRFMTMLRNKELPDPDQKPPALHLGLANEEGFPHKGHLDFRELSVNQETGTALRRGIFPNPGRQLIPGMFVRIQASIGEPKPRILIDERAIGADQRGDYLLVVNDKNVVEYRSVKLGMHVGTMRAIDSGINVNDWVIVNGLQRAKPGAEVKPDQAAGTAEAKDQSAAKAEPKANAAPTVKTGNDPINAAETKSEASTDKPK